MQAWAPSTFPQNIIGQPPTIGSIPSERHSPTACSETLPSPSERWNQTCRTPRAAQARTISGADAGGETTITASSVPGTAARSG